MAINRLLNNLKFHLMFSLSKSIIRCALTTIGKGTSFINILCTLLPLTYINPTVNLREYLFLVNILYYPQGFPCNDKSNFANLTDL